MTKEREAEILAYLDRLPADKREAVRKQIIDQDGAEGAFLAGGVSSGQTENPALSDPIPFAGPEPEPKKKRRKK